MINMNKLPISVIVPVRNEEKNLLEFIPLLSDFDEVIIVDSNSTDNTVKIAERFGCKVYQFKWNGQFPKKRNWALRNIPIKNEWVFFVDADEFMTPDFINNLRITMADTQNYVAYWILYTNVFLGRKMTHSGIAKKLALFKKSAGE